MLEKWFKKLSKMDEDYVKELNKINQLTLKGKKSDALLKLDEFISTYWDFDYYDEDEFSVIYYILLYFSYVNRRNFESFLEDFDKLDNMGPLDLEYFSMEFIEGNFRLINKLLLDLNLNNDFYHMDKLENFDGLMCRLVEEIDMYFDLSEYDIDYHNYISKSSQFIVDNFCEMLNNFANLCKIKTILEKARYYEILIDGLSIDFKDVDEVLDYDFSQHQIYPDDSDRKYYQKEISLIYDSLIKFYSTVTTGILKSKLQFIMSFDGNKCFESIENYLSSLRFIVDEFNNANIVYEKVLDTDSDGKIVEKMVQKKSKKANKGLVIKSASFNKAFIENNLESLLDLESEIKDYKKFLGRKKPSKENAILYLREILKEARNSNTIDSKITDINKEYDSKLGVIENNISIADSEIVDVKNKIATTRGLFSGRKIKDLNARLDMLKDQLDKLNLDKASIKRELQSKINDISRIVTPKGDYNDLINLITLLEVCLKSKNQDYDFIFDEKGVCSVYDLDLVDICSCYYADYYTNNRIEKSLIDKMNEVLPDIKNLRKEISIILKNDNSLDKSIDNALLIGSNNIFPKYDNEKIFFLKQSFSNSNDVEEIIDLNTKDNFDAKNYVDVDSLSKLFSNLDDENKYKVKEIVVSIILKVLSVVYNFENMNDILTDATVAMSFFK